MSIDFIEKPSLLTFDQVAEILNLSRSGLHHRLRSTNDNPPSIKIGKRRFFPKNSFEAWLNKKIDQ